MCRHLTSQTTKTSYFKGDATFTEKVKKWCAVLKSICKESFKKIRIKQSRTIQVSSRIKALINQRNELMKVKKSIINMEAVEKKNVETTNLIADLEAKEKREQIIKQFAYFSKNPDKIELQKMWQILKRVSPKLKPTIPCAKRNSI